MPFKLNEPRASIRRVRDDADPAQVDFEQLLHAILAAAFFFTVT